MIHLQNNIIKLSIDSLGAELRHLIWQPTSCELLWQARPDVWPRCAPVLFPIVGRLRQNAYRYKGIQYPLSQHGFARDLHFDCLSATSTQAHFVLNANENTLSVFPFRFELHIVYTLHEQELQVVYIVKNTDSVTMPFSIGAHPGFKLPFYTNETAEDYFLRFESDNYQITSLENGLRQREERPFPIPGKTLPLSATLFDNDALIFETAQIREVSLCSKNHPLAITLKCEDWPYFGIWSKKGPLQFVCLEPWMGITDATDAGDDLFSKDGMLLLEPQQEKEFRYSIVINT
ncbi:MAG: aldose 1-epimerase family protein [Sediminibacterium sp.]|nr:aldose 1-epimerase family protein [Sediminibacterium sp.]